MRVPLGAKDIVGWGVRFVSVLVPKNDTVVFCSTDGYVGNGRAFHEAVERSDLIGDTKWLSLGPHQDASFARHSVPNTPLISLRGLAGVDLEARVLEQRVPAEGDGDAVEAEQRHGGGRIGRPGPIPGAARPEIPDPLARPAAKERWLPDVGPRG